MKRLAPRSEWGQLTEVGGVRLGLTAWRVGALWEHRLARLTPGLGPCFALASRSSLPYYRVVTGTGWQETGLSCPVRESFDVVQALGGRRTTDAGREAEVGPGK